MDDIIKICDDLEKNKDKDKELEVVRAYKMVDDYINHDKNKLLQLKADLKRHENFNDNTIKILSFLMSAIALILTIINGFGDKILFIKSALVYLGIFTFLVLIVVFFSNRNTARSKWLKYISVALDEIEKNFDKKEIVTNKKRKNKKDD
ncbi:MAG: hypothetical protein EGS63_05260 [Lachnospira sp.]|nr:hypothetical protein [Lachnospira sp.]